MQLILTLVSVRPIKEWVRKNGYILIVYLLSLLRYRIELVSPNSYEIDFATNPISYIAAYFFIINLKFIFTPFFKIKISEIIFLTRKLSYFRRPIFIKQHNVISFSSHPNQLHSSRALRKVIGYNL